MAGTTRTRPGDPEGPPLTVAHVGILGEEPGGMAQVVNGYLAWRGGGIDHVGIRSTRRRHDPAAPLLAASAAVRIVALAVRARLSRRATIAVFHLSEGGSFVREGLLLRLASAMGLQTVAHIHGADFDGFALRRPDLVRRVLRAASATAVLTDRSAAVVRDLVGQDAHVAIVPNTVTAASGASVRHREVLFGGEVGPRKGVDVLLEAWGRVEADHPAWRLTLAGPIAAGYRVPHPLPPRAEMLGSLRHEELLGQLRTASIAVLPSRQEALPMFLLEAMAAGCAVIGSTAGQVPTVLADGAGAVVEPGDAGALAAALQRLMSDDAGRAEAAARATARFESAFSTESARPGLERFWREVADG